MNPSLLVDSVSTNIIYVTFRPLTKRVETYEARALEYPEYPEYPE